MRLLAIILVWSAGAAFAGEYAVLSSGSRLHVDRHEVDGSKVRLYNGTGYAEMDAADIRGFEVEDYIPPAPAPAPPPPEVKAPTPSPLELADAAADKYGLPRLLVRRVMAAESGFQLDALSPKGAIGLMQLMPGTAQILGANPNDPLQNVDAGARYLRGLLEKYGGYLRPALAAYNAGPGAVSKFGGVPPYRETLNYVHRIETDLCRAGAVICSVKP